MAGVSRQSDLPQLVGNAAVRKILFAVALILLAAPAARAQVGGVCTTVDGPCSSLADQLLQYTEQGLQLNQETITAVQEYTSALELGQTSFEDLTNDINQILGIVNTANMLVNQTGQIIINLSGGHGYPLGNIANWHQQLSNESLAVGNAMKACGQATNLLQSVANDARLLTSLVNQIMAVFGRQQSLQTLGGQLSQLGQSLQKMESGAMACRQGGATYQAARQDWHYMIQSVSDQDNEITVVNECNIVAQLGFVPSGCSGEYPAGTQAALLAAAGGGIIGGTAVANADQDYRGGAAAETSAEQNFGGTGTDAAAANQDFGGGASGTGASANQDFGAGGTTATTGSGSQDDSAAADQLLGTTAAETPPATTGGDTADEAVIELSGAID
jgi:hypothetical protein